MREGKTNKEQVTPISAITQSGRIYKTGSEMV